MRGSDFNLAREIRKNRRYRTLGTNNPYCRVCGKYKWWVRYEEHHPAGKKYDQRTIMLCIDCHNEVTEMMKEFPQIPAHVPYERGELIQMMRGQAELLFMSAERCLLVADKLLGSPTILPDEPGVED